MATKLYTEDINKRIDWGGDENTNGLPVAGEKVQKFIKDTLNKKFGKIYYDKDNTYEENGEVIVADHSASKKYLIFADQEDFETWGKAPGDNSALILGSFDAPAPANIIISDIGLRTKTILLSDVSNQKVSFKYLIKDSSGTPQPSRMSVAVSIQNSISGTTTIPTDIVNMSTNPEEPTEYVLSDLGKYLNAGTNTIIITVTALDFSVSTNVTYQYNVLDLSISSTFDNSDAAFNYFNGISLDSNEFFSTVITAIGAGDKFLRVFVDSKQIELFDSENRPTQDLFIGKNTPATYELYIPFKNLSGEFYDWTTPGKHSLQMYFYIKDEANQEIKSQTLYYDFVLTAQGMQHGSYILFSSIFEQNAFQNNVGTDKSIIESGNRFNINVEQYLGFTANYAVFDTSGRGNSTDGSAVVVEIGLYDKSNLSTAEFLTTQQVKSGSTSTFNYTTSTHGNKELQIKSTIEDGGETVYIDVNIEKSSVEASVTSQQMIFEFKAVNRSNTENAEDRETWEYIRKIGQTIQPIKAQFNKVLWNNQNGWIDNCLVLNNGATVTIPYNIFINQGSGVTFEIDFETANVQDDNAVIMKFGSSDTAHININACVAELQSDNRTNIHTNYKDGARQKIAFIFGYNGENVPNESTYDCPYLMYIVVNGILDRVAALPKNETYTGEESFTIGNLDGKVTTKIHSIRAYNRAIRLDECVDNYIADSDDIRGKYLRNDIYNEDKKTININSILSKNINIPVMTIFGDITNSIVQVFNKKSNVPVDVLYQDPNYPEFNYFARDAWMSNQGTSSMNYPRRNLRLYLNKEADSKTLRGFASNARYDFATRIWYGLTDSTTIANIQNGTITDLDAPITVNNVTYTCLSNKKTLKEKPQKINYSTAVWFVHSGIKIYSDSSCSKTAQIKKLNKYINDNPGGEIWVQGAYARYKGKDLYTDRWTLKCDYAESSMTHNAGVGRLWGDVLRNVEVGSEGFTYDINGDKINTTKPGMTNAQRAAQKYEEEHNGKLFGDIRTSCDGYPIIIVNRPRIKDSNNQYTEEYGDPIFLGLYNIMTDKGSTPLFGFEDLKDEDGNTIFDAGNDEQRTECWECLQNGSALAQMSTIVTDDVDGSTVPYTSQFDSDGKYKSGGSDNKDRPIFKTYEARWPDNDDLNDTKTNKLESVIRFVNFCKNGLSVKVGDIESAKDGYELSDFTEITEDQARKLSELTDPKQAANVISGLNNWNGKLYIGVPAISYKDKTTTFYAKDDSGNILYDSNDKPILLPADNETVTKAVNKGIYYYQDYAAQNVTGYSFSPLYNKDTLTPARAQAVIDQLNSNRPYVFTAERDETEIEQVESLFYEGSGMKWFIFDNTYDRSIITKTINNDKLTDDVYTGRVKTYDGKRVKADGEELHPDAWVTVYLTKNGNNYTYTNEMGEAGTRYASGEEVVTVTGSGNTISPGESFKGHTLFEYFQDQKYEHFDIWKLAAYYVYMMRFAAVDQVIKNTMMTTEDGIHYYFINYDNDTILGVRNDGYLAYDWQITRESYDYSIGAYAYAGFGSVLWNMLEMDEDFLAKVKTVATAMVTSNVLTYDIALDMFNNKQSGTWSERLYNNSEMYKYIGIYKNIDDPNATEEEKYKNTKYLPFLQGSRASHRDWWLRHRFDLYDSKWSAGEYSIDSMNFYESTNASASNRQNIVRVVSASKFYYTVESNNRTLDGNFFELQADEEHIFSTQTSLAIGDPLKMLGAYKARVIDFSEHRNNLGASLEFKWSANKSSMIEELIIGGNKTLAELPAGSLGSIEGLEKLQALRVLDVRTNQFSTANRNLNISTLGNLRKFLAINSNITTFAPAEGVILDEVSLPSTIQTLKMNNIEINNQEEVLYTAEDEEVIAGTKVVGDVKTPFKEGFIYNPNTALKRAEISDVTGTAFDLLQFLITWYDDLKKYNAKVSDYSCSLSFGTIELPQYIGNESGEIAEDITDYVNSLNSANPKKIKSLLWLNAIKNDFGYNALGEENFFIKKGVIKLYGDSTEIEGGLTQENYEMLTSVTYNNSTIRLWSDDAFRADTSFHFDAEKSIFVKVESLGNNPKYLTFDGNDYNIVSGQKAKITITVFPINNDRKITFEPRTYQNGVNTLWLKSSNGTYQYSFGEGVKYSYLTNDNGIAILDTAEYTTSNDKFVQITVKDSLDTSGGDIAYINFNINRIYKPSEFYLFYQNNGVNANIQSRHELNTVEEHIYNVVFDSTTTENMNVDIAKIEASFSENTITPVSDKGSLETEIITNPDESLTYQVRYLPIIQDETSSFSIFVVLTLDDKNKTKVTRELPIRLTTKLVEDIIVKFNGTELEKIQKETVNIIGYDNGTPIYETLEQYNTEQYIQNLNNQQIVEYEYDIEINPSTFNVTITSMELEFPNGTSQEFQITKNNINNITNVVEGFKLTVNNLNRKQSIYTTNYFNIKIIDVFGNITEKVVNVTVGCFYPDEIKLLKQETLNSIQSNWVAKESEALKVNLLSQDVPTVNYEFHIYSSIRGELYVWGNTEDIVSNEYTQNNGYSHFLTSEKTPNVTESIIKLSKADEDPNPEVSLQQFTTQNIVPIGRTFAFTLSEASKGQLWSRKTQVEYSVTFNGRSFDYDKIFEVERTSALATNANWRSSIIKPYTGEKDSNGIPLDGIYYLDKELRLYDYEGLGRAHQGQIISNIENYFVALLFVYTDSNDNKKCITFDPWQMNKTYYWWKTGSIYATDVDHGTYFVITHEFLRLCGVLSVEDLQTLPVGTVFKAYADWYRLICSRNNDYDRNGGTFRLEGDFTDINTLEDQCVALYEGRLKFTNMSNFDDTDMIYSNINYYNNKGMSNIICKLLSAQDIAILMSHYDDIAIFLDQLDGKTGTLKQSLFDKAHYIIDSSSNETSWDSVNINNVTDSNLRSKIFWYFYVPTTNYLQVQHGLDNVQVAYDTYTDFNSEHYDNSDIDVHINAINDGQNRLISSDKKLYCLWGPQI